MNKRKLFSFFTLFSIFLSGCKTKADSSTSSPFIEPAKKVENLHQVQADFEKGTTFIENSTSTYQLVMGDSNGINKAGNFLLQYIEKATGVTLKTASPDTISDSDTYIVIGRDDLFNHAGLEMPSSEVLGASGYVIKTKGKSCYLQAYKKEGYHMAVLAFLRETLGYDMISLDTISFSLDGHILPYLDIVEKPDFDYRHYSNTMDPNALYGMGYTDDEVFLPINGWSTHNTLHILPLDKYQSSHPSWYEPGGIDICYNANGNKEEYKKMVKETANVLLPLIEKRPELDNIVISSMDYPTLCSCDACMKDLAKYGSKASSIIRFLNDVDDIFQDHFKGKREVNLILLAYHESENAPVREVTDENGNKSYVPSGDEVICHKNVGVEIAPIMVDYCTTFTDPVNEKYAENIKAWRALTNKIYIYSYETNFRAALYPYNTWSYVYDSFKFYYEQGAVYVFNSGQLFQSCFTGFTYLKDYLDSKALFNVNSSYSEDVDKFFDYYFRTAATPMRNFYESVRSYLHHLITTTPELTGNIYDTIDNVNYWPKGVLECYMDYINEAYQSILPLKESDIALYETTYRHIKIESIFPRYALATLYADFYSNYDLKELRQGIVDDCHELNITAHTEHGFIKDVFTEWGF